MTYRKQLIQIANEVEDLRLNIYESNLFDNLDKIELDNLLFHIQSELRHEAVGIVEFHENEVE